MAVPAWFDVNVYMANKLVQMQGADPAGNWTDAKLAQAFTAAGFLGAEGAFNHFAQFGAQEDVAPNSLFNANEYYTAKAAQFYTKSASALTALEVSTVKQLIKDAGMNAWTHYNNFGSSEGVNPSNSFDESDYLAAKLVALQAADAATWAGKTVDDVSAAFKAAGFSALTHFLLYKGTGAAEVAGDATFTVPASDQVPADTATSTGQTFTLTDGIDNLTGTSGNDTFIGDQATSSAADQLNGGAATDTFKLFTTGAVSLPTMNSVENLFIEGANVAIDSSSAAGVTSLELSKYDLTADRDVKVADGTKVTISNTTAVAGPEWLTLTNNTATSQDIAVSLSGDATNAVDIDIDGAKVETLSVEATGKSFINVANTGALLKTVNISGSADLVVENVAIATAINITNTAKTSVDSAVAKVAVTGGAGAETVTLDHAAAAQEFSVSTGAGDDKVALTSLNATAHLTDSKVTISGGEGTDTLVMLSALGSALSAMSATDYAKKGIANDFEVLAISNQAAAADDVNITRLGSNITTVDYAAGLGDAGQTLTDLASNGTVVLGAAAGVPDTDKLTVSVKDAGKAGSGADILNIKLDGLHVAAGMDYSILEAANVETINLDSTTTKTTALVTANTNTLDLVVANAENINIKGNVYLDLSGDALDGSALKTVNASENTAGVAVSVAGATQGILITGTAKDDVIVGGNGADEIIAGAGDDVITGGDGNDEIDISGGGSNTLTFAATGALNDKDTITGFNVGAVAAGGDVLEVSAILGASAITANITSLNGAQQLADDNIFTVNFAAAIADKDFGGADFADLFAAAGKAFSTTNDAADDEAVIVVQGTDVTHIYYFDDADNNTTVAAADVTLVGVLDGVTNANTFVAANFA